MKRSRNIVIAVCLIVVVIAGSLYAVWKFAGSENQPVKVAPVSTLDFSSSYDDFYDYEEEPAGNIEGSIVSRDSQHIALESDLELKEVLVKEGDKVKAGDVLLVYDMTEKELEREMQDLEVQVKRIYLNKAEKDLEKLKSKYPSLYESMMASRTKAEDISVSDEKTSEKDSGKRASLEPETNIRTMEGGGSDLLDLDDEVPFTGEAEYNNDELLAVDPVGGNDESGYSDGSATDDVIQLSEDEEQELVSLPDESSDSEEPETHAKDSEKTDENTEDILLDEENETDALIEVIPDEDEGNTADEELDHDMMRVLTEFLAAVNVLSREYSASRYELELDDVMDALRIFEENLGVESSDPEIVDPDAFGEISRIPVYVVSQETIDLLARSDSLGFETEEMIRLLEQGYLRALYFRLVAEMNLILPGGKTISDLSDEEVKGMEEQIRVTADAFYRVYFNWRYLNDKYYSDSLMQTFLKDYEDALKALSIGGDAEVDMLADPGLGTFGEGPLSLLIKRLGESVDVYETEELETEIGEPDTEFPDDFDDDIGDDFEDTPETEEDADEMMFDAIQDFLAKELDLRTEALKLKKLDEELEKGTVVAGIDGVVRQAGSIDDVAVLDDFIVIFGGKGLYAMGTVSEFKRSSLNIGDTVKGTTEEGVAFTAKVTEISQYPQDGSSDYYYYSSEMENTTASYYPFYAFIEDDTDIAEGYAMMSLETANNTSRDIGLEKMYIRQEPNGRSYVFAVGEDGKLEKRYVSVYPSDYLIYVSEGLSKDDLIAFPYGDNVKEGASVVEAASLFDDEDEIYW